MTFQIGQYIGTGDERFAIYPTLADARKAAARWLGRTLADDMRGACPDEDGLIGIECWMPYIDDNHVPVGTVFVYRVVRSGAGG